MVPFVNVKISVNVNIAKIPLCHRAGQFECEYGLQCSFKREGNPCFTILTYEEFVVKVSQYGNPFTGIWQKNFLQEWRESSSRKKIIIGKCLGGHRSVGGH